MVIYYKVVLEIDLPALTSNASAKDTTHQPKYVDNLGEAIIDYVELRIGGQRIDRQYGEWMHIWNELTLTSGRKTGYDRMVRATGVNGPLTVYVPLQFWFCRNIASALPLVALQYHEVELAIQLNPLNKLYKFGETHYYDLAGTNPYTISSGKTYSAFDFADKVILEHQLLKKYINH